MATITPRVRPDGVGVVPFVLLIADGVGDALALGEVELLGAAISWPPAGNPLARTTAPTTMAATTMAARTDAPLMGRSPPHPVLRARFRFAGGYTSIPTRLAYRFWRLASR